MTQRVEAPPVTVPDGTLSTAPLDFDLTWQPGVVRLIEVIVPPGPSGLVGFAIGHSGQVIIPRSAGQWVITDDEPLRWDVDDYPTGAAWFIRAYNEDIYDHTLYFRFHLDEIEPRRAGPVVLLDITQPDMPQVVNEG